MASRALSAEQEQRPSSLRGFLENSVFGTKILRRGRLLLIRFSSLVPPQTPEAVDPLVITHIENEYAKLKSKNKLTVESLHGGRPWVADHRHWNYEAAKRATKVRILSTIRTMLNIRNFEQEIYGRDPDLTREGGSIPVTLTFAEALGVSVLLLPMGRGDDGAQ
jgi:Cys-Gly metallodipeptidase DUG1